MLGRHIPGYTPGYVREAMRRIEPSLLPVLVMGDMRRIEPSLLPVLLVRDHEAHRALPAPCVDNVDR